MCGGLGLNWGEVSRAVLLGLLSEAHDGGGTQPCGFLLGLVKYGGALFVLGTMPDLLSIAVKPHEVV